MGWADMRRQVWEKYLNHNNPPVLSRRTDALRETMNQPEDLGERPVIMQLTSFLLACSGVQILTELRQPTAKFCEFIRKSRG
jgi:hypothetical protein